MSKFRDATITFGNEGRLNMYKDFSKLSFVKLYTMFPRLQMNELKTSTVVVFLSLASHIDGDGKCFISNERIKQEAGVSLKTVKRAKRELIEEGYLHVRQEVWTEQLAYERYPIKKDDNGKDKNKEKRDKILNEKLGRFATNTYSLFPFVGQDKENQGKEESYPQASKKNSNKNDRGEHFADNGDRGEHFAHRGEHFAEEEKSPSNQEADRREHFATKKNDRGEPLSPRQLYPTKNSPKDLKQELKEEGEERLSFFEKSKRLVDNLPEEYQTEVNYQFVVDFYKTFSKYPSLKQLELIFERTLDNRVMFYLLEITAMRNANIGYFFTVLEDVFSNGLTKKGEIVRHINDHKRFNRRNSSY